MAGHQKQFPKAVCSVLPHGAVVITYVAICLLRKFQHIDALKTFLKNFPDSKKKEILQDYEKSGPK